jgi:hypothetical protein
MEASLISLKASTNRVKRNPKGDKKMQELYIPPELILAGETKEVVLGSAGIGSDFWGQRMPHGAEFEADDNPAILLAESANPLGT